MPTATGKTMNIGQHERFHVKVYAQDNANNPSQVVDLTTPLVVAVPALYSNIVQAAVDSADNRAVIVTAIGAGGGFVDVNTSPGLAGGQLQVSVTVAAPPPQNSRIDFLAADDPT